MPAKPMRWAAFAVFILSGFALFSLSCGSSPKITCPPGFALCSNECVSLRTDASHCGACETACGDGQVCSNSACADNCPLGQNICNGACVDRQSDSSNCGTCGTVCDAGLQCVVGECKVDCASNLLNPLPDSWGAKWDGLERKAATFADARSACEAIGGRLPTATELYRVSASQSGQVGQTYMSNNLWSFVPADPGNQVVVRLDTGATNTSSSTAALSASSPRYRCICPPTQPAAFTGHSCYGPPGDECFPLPNGPQATQIGPFNMDSSDRAPLPKGAAMWECGFYHAHLPELATYVEAIRFGLPNGSARDTTSSWLHTADDAKNDLTTAISWEGVATNWQVSTSTVSAQATSIVSFFPFRCVGMRDAAQLPVAGTSQRVDPRTGIMGDTVDRPAPSETSAANNWAKAHDVCWNAGGHLARSAELGTLIQGGLSGGTGSWLWTADQAGHNGTQFVVMELKWTDADLGIDPRTQFAFGYYNDKYVHWAYKSTNGATLPFRCIYYPIDPTYQEPTQCAGASGCARFQLPSSTAVMWMDSGDRPGLPLESAIYDCAAVGGHLALERDYTETIRLGLPAGSGKPLLTSDVGWGNSSFHGLVVNWSGIDQNFNDQYPTYMTWQGLGTSSPYRCMWTNELR